ncbi:ribonuclease [Brevundimonas sp.]|uniref:ribonuclease n=1 Tax=Brevundimonas sp. TaxID=1871086 RepID=UPI00272FCEBF|nr:ribonuclease [Brevundimonas sp.]MDP1912253.1 ribonuclease [Brevundimonas sp.]
MFRTGLASSSGVLRQALCKWGVALVAASGLVAGAALLSTAQARTAETPAAVALATLPPQALEAHRLILSGGPFPYPKDGTVFGNRERLLPSKARGYYREYTVKTPGSYDRGARRIVCGGHPPTQPEACFYTDDHYASFRRIAP